MSSFLTTSSDLDSILEGEFITIHESHARGILAQLKDGNVEAYGKVLPSYRHRMRIVDSDGNLIIESPPLEGTANHINFQHEKFETVANFVEYMSDIRKRSSVVANQMAVDLAGRLTENSDWYNGWTAVLAWAFPDEYSTSNTSKQDLGKVLPDDDEF